MYKIYVNDTPLLLASQAEASGWGQGSESSPVLWHAGKPKFLKSVLNQLESSKRFEQMVVVDADVERLWADFASIFKFIEAAGGVVFNDKKEALLIFRRGHWDLPKGKIDQGETPEQAAVREIQEETGLQNVHLGNFLAETFHTYEQDGKRILKKTWWYLMQTDEQQLKLQHEEDIEAAQWVTLDKFLIAPEKIYGSVLDVLRKATSDVTTSGADSPRNPSANRK